MKLIRLLEFYTRQAILHKTATLDTVLKGQLHMSRLTTSLKGG